MDNTNYSLLSIVGIVAITAIIAMFIHSDRSLSDVGGPRIALVDSAANQASGNDAALTGYVAVDRSPQPTGPRPSPAFSVLDYDYDNSGTLDLPDAIILSDVVDRKRFCPPGKTCDLDGSGIVDLRDLGAFNTRLLEEAVARQQSSQPSLLTGNAVTNTARAQPTSRASTISSYWAGATGAPRS